MTRYIALIAAGTVFVCPSSAGGDGAFPAGMSVLLPRDRPSEIILAATFGLLFSEDDGASWQFACETEATRNGRLYMVGPPPANRLYATSDTGAAVSTDDGCTWTVGRGDLDGMRVFDVFPDPIEPMKVVALAAGGLTAEVGSSAYLSSDGGFTYAGPLLTAPLSSIVTGVETAGATIYVTFWEIPGVHPRLARSYDGGATWATLDLEPKLGEVAPFIAAVDRDDPRKLYLRLSGMTPDLRVLESLAITTDAGETWSIPLSVPERQLTGLLRRRSGTILVTAGPLVTDGTTPHLAFRSDDGGATFVDWPLPLRAKGLAERDRRLFVAADNYLDGFALASSDDDGSSWTPLLRFEDVDGIRPCVRESCQYDCDLLAGDKIFPPETCNPVADAGTDARTAASDAGCGCAAGPPIGSPENFAALGVSVAVMSFARRHRGRFRS